MCIHIYIYIYIYGYYYYVYIYIYVYIGRSCEGYGVCLATRAFKHLAKWIKQKHLFSQFGAEARSGQATAADNCYDCNITITTIILTPTITASMTVITIQPRGRSARRPNAPRRPKGATPTSLGEAH